MRALLTETCEIWTAQVWQGFYMNRCRAWRAGALTAAVLASWPYR
jgi:hypothetical protein